MPSVQLSEINRRRLTLTIRGTTPLIQHKWDEKAKRQMREKHAGKKTKSRDVRDPEAECGAATHVTADGQYGIPAGALRAAIIGAAHKDLGIEKTLVRKALFVLCDDKENTLPIEAEPPVMREDVVRVGQGSTDLRYRPEFSSWSCTFTIEYNAILLTVEAILSLLDWAGFGVGLLEMRPEKGGEFGRFEVDRSMPIEDESADKEILEIKIVA